jgi:hypothetical protein
MAARSGAYHLAEVINPSQRSGSPALRPVGRQPVAMIEPVTRTLDRDSLCYNLVWTSSTSRDAQ